MAIYLKDIIPFRFMIKPDTSRNGFLFGDEKGPWKTDKITKVLARESTKRLGFRMTVADYRHISVAMNRKFIRGIDLELTDDDDEDDPHDLMASHRTRIAVNRYGRQAGLLKKLTPESIDIFRTIADNWQKWLDLIPRKPREEADEVINEDELDIPLQDKLKGALTKLYGPTAIFKGKQEEGMTAIVKGISPLIICLPTGGGKSLSFLLPACFNDAKTTVVITPLVALSEDMLRRCKEANIKSFIYGTTRTTTANVVIIVTETAVSSRFSQYILDLHLENKLERIIFDEAHKLVKDVNYRPKLEDLYKLSLPVQYVYLTATMPPTMVAEFIEKVSIQEPHIVRQASHKANFRYTVSIYDGDDFENTSLNLIRVRAEKYTGNEKAVQIK